jgi:hypothetical protein
VTSCGNAIVGSRRALRAVAAALLGAQLSACTGWRQQPLPPSPRTGSVGTARVTRSDQSVVLLRNVRIERDSLVGFGDEGRVAIATAEVAQLDVRMVDTTRTVLAVGATAVGAFVALMAAVFYALTENDL